MLVVNQLKGGDRIGGLVLRIKVVSQGNQHAIDFYAGFICFSEVLRVRIVFE